MSKYETKDHKLVPGIAPYRTSETRDRFDWDELKRLFNDFVTIQGVADALNVPYHFLYSYIRYNKEHHDWYKKHKSEVAKVRHRSRSREWYQKRHSTSKQEAADKRRMTLEAARTTQLDNKKARRQQLIEELQKSDPQAAKALQDLELAEIA